jgi:hypothetical protein
VQYVGGLNSKHAVPTRQNIKDSAMPVAKRVVNESWVTRFINRYKDRLILTWTTVMDSIYKKANSRWKYKLCLE